jgi:hypothetical protein
LVFPRHALSNRLRAFEPRGRIEVRALLAGMQFESAFRTLAHGIFQRRKYRPALPAARHRMRCSQLNRPGTDCLWPRGPVFAMTLPARRAFTAVAILISVLSILLVGQKIPFGKDSLSGG